MANRRTLRAWRIRLSLALLALALSAGGAFAQDRPKVEIVPQMQHSGVVDELAFTPDGTRAVSASWDGSLKVWEVGTGRLVRTIYGSAGGFFSLALTPDGTQMLAGERQRALTLWDLATGQPVRRFEGHSNTVLAVAISADGAQAVSAGHDKTIRLWDVSTGRQLRVLAGHAGSVLSIQFSPNGTQLISSSWDKTAKLWDLATGSVVRTFSHGARLATARFSKDGNHVLTGCADGSINIWDAVSGELLRTVRGHTAWVSTIVFSPDGRLIASGSERDKTIKFWDARTLTLLRSVTLSGDAEGVSSIAFSSDGTVFLSGNREGEIILWDRAESRQVRTFGQPLFRISSVAFSPNGANVLSGSADTTAKLWNVASGELVREFKGPASAITSVAFSPDGSRVAAGSNDRTVKIWDSATGKSLHSLDGHGGRGVYSVAFSPSGGQLLSGDGLGALRLWDVDTGKLLRSIDAIPRGFIASVAFSPDGRWLLSGGSDGMLKLWNAKDGELIRKFQGHRDRIWSVAFSPDGAHILSGGFDATANLWDANSGHVLHTFEGHSGWVIRSVAFSATGAELITADSNGEIKVWDTSTHALLRTLHSTPVDAVAFSPSGSIIASGGDDTTTKLWDLASGGLLASLTAKADGEWLAMTPAGFFAASREGTEMLRAVRGLEVTSIAQLFDHLYRPDLVEEALKGDREGKYKDEAFRLNLQKILDTGPAPQIEHIEQRDASAGSTFRLAVRLTDVGGGIGDKVVWRVGDQVRAVSSARIMSGAATDKAVTVRASIPVDPSRDTLVEVTGYNGAGLLTTLPYQIRIDKFGATTEERPRMYVLAIGVSKYRMPDYELKLAAKDAAAFGEALKKVAGGLFGADKVFVKTLLDEQVSKKDIEVAFDEIAARAKLGDVFVLYLSGHGKSVAGRYYYYPQTLDFARGQRVEQDGVGQDALQAWIAQVAAQKKVVIIDTCESSAAAGLIRGGTSTRRTAMDQLQHATGENLIAAARQAAFEGWHGHGVLTYALLEAMNKKDGGTDDERIKVAGLASFVDERVPEISQELTGLYQKPTYRLSGSDFPIGIREAVLTPDSAIPSTPTHVLVRSTRVLERAAADAQGERELLPGTQVRVLKFEGAWALIARDSQELGFVPAEALVTLQ
jgi:WD40 repeat protein